MYDSKSLVQNIKNRAKEKNILIKSMLTACDLSINAISQISDKKGLSSFSLAKIADYLDVSTDYLLGRTDNPEINKAPVLKQEPTNIIRIPFEVSKVSAGYGAYISDDYPETLEIDVNTYPKADFAVQITGDSMQPDYINGKIVLVHKQPYLENGQIGIFMYNGEGYIKQYHIENDMISLISLNSKYKPITPKPTDDFHIVGHVLYTLSFFPKG